MSELWLEKYSALRDFIAADAGIQIGATLTVIPSEVRAEFYLLFDEIRRNFVEGTIPDSVTEGRTLGLNFAGASQAVAQMLKLTRVELDADLAEFLRDPVTGLAPLLFDPLFDLLKGAVQTASFVETARATIAAAAKRHLAAGYTYWTILSLVKLLRPDSNYAVPVRDELLDSALGDATPDHLFEENVPEVMTSTEISFQQHGLHQAFIVPKVLVHSAHLNCFAAVHYRFDDAEPMNRALAASPRQDWLEAAEIIRTFGTTSLWPDIALYTSPEPGDLALVADYLRSMRPQLSVEVRQGKDWHKGKAFEVLRRHSQVLKPKLGTFVVCREDIPPEALAEFTAETDTIQKQSKSKPAGEEREGDIYLLNAGYNPARLEPIMVSLAGNQPSADA
jgi:hypothetical protein